MSRSVRRNGAALGEFNDAEIGRLLAKGRLQSTDEVRADSGQWVPLGVYAQSLAPIAQTGSSTATPGRPAARGFFVHYQGRRHGPFDIPKLEAMVRTGLLDASAMVEPADGSAPASPIGSLLASSLPQPVAQGQAVQPVVGGGVPTATLPGADDSDSSGDSSSAQGNQSFMELWIVCSFWIFVGMAALGYLNNRGRGLAAMMGAGLLLAPIKGAILAWIIWAVRRK
jgi:hypothetical protein